MASLVLNLLVHHSCLQGMVYAALHVSWCRLRLPDCENVAEQSRQVSFGLALHVRQCEKTSASVGNTLKHRSHGYPAESKLMLYN